MRRTATAGNILINGEIFILKLKKNGYIVKTKKILTNGSNSSLIIINTALDRLMAKW